MAGFKPLPVCARDPKDGESVEKNLMIDCVEGIREVEEDSSGKLFWTGGEEKQVDLILHCTFQDVSSTFGKEAVTHTH